MDPYRRILQEGRGSEARIETGRADVRRSSRKKKVDRMSYDEFIDYNNRIDEEQCIITVRCKSKDIPQIKRALIQMQGCAAGENVGAKQGSPPSLEGERELMERGEAMRTELTTIAKFVKDIQVDLKETLGALGDKVKNLERRIEMLEEPVKGLEASRAARKDTLIGHDGEDKRRNRRSSRRKKAAAAKAEMYTHRTEEEI